MLGSGKNSRSSILSLTTNNNYTQPITSSRQSIQSHSSVSPSGAMNAIAAANPNSRNTPSYKPSTASTSSSITQAYRSYAQQNAATNGAVNKNTSKSDKVPLSFISPSRLQSTTMALATPIPRPQSIYDQDHTLKSKKDNSAQIAPSKVTNMMRDQHMPSASIAHYSTPLPKPTSPIISSSQAYWSQKNSKIPASVTTNGYLATSPSQQQLHHQQQPASPVYTINLSEDLKQSHNYGIPPYNPHVMNRTNNPLEEEASSYKQQQQINSKNADGKRKTGSQGTFDLTAYQHKPTESVHQKGNNIDVTAKQQSTTQADLIYQQQQQVMKAFVAGKVKDSTIIHPQLSKQPQQMQPFMSEQQVQKTVNKENQLIESEYALNHMCSMCMQNQAKLTWFSDTKATPLFLCQKCSQENAPTDATKSSINNNNIINPIALNKSPSQYSLKSQSQQQILKPHEQTSVNNPPPAAQESVKFQQLQQFLKPNSGYTNTQLIPLDKKAQDLLNGLSDNQSQQQNYSNGYQVQEPMGFLQQQTATTAAPSPAMQSNDQSIKKEKIFVFSSRLFNTKDNFQRILKQFTDLSESSIQAYHSNLKFIDGIGQSVIQALEGMIAESKQKLINSFNESLAKFKDRQFQIQQILNYLHSTEKDLQTNIDSIIADMDVGSLDDIIQEYSAMINEYEATRQNELLPDSFMQLELQNKANSSLVQRFHSRINEEISKILETQQITVRVSDLYMRQQQQQQQQQQLQHLVTHNLQPSSSVSLGQTQSQKAIYVSFENKDIFSNNVNVAAAAVAQEYQLRVQQSQLQQSQPYQVYSTPDQQSKTPDHQLVQQTIHQTQQQQQQPQQQFSPSFFNTATSTMQSPTSLTDQNTITPKVQSSIDNHPSFQLLFAPPSTVSPAESQAEHKGEQLSAKQQTYMKYDIQTSHDKALLPSSSSYAFSENTSHYQLSNPCVTESSQSQLIRTSNQKNPISNSLQSQLHTPIPSNSNNNYYMSSEQSSDVKKSNNLYVDMNATKNDHLLTYPPQQMQYQQQQPTVSSSQGFENIIRKSNSNPLSNKQKYTDLINRIQLNQSHTEKLCTDALVAAPTQKGSLAEEQPVPPIQSSLQMRTSRQ